MPFGGGAGMCPGRMFARNEIKLFLCVMLYHFELELIPDKRCGEMESERAGIFES